LPREGGGWERLRGIHEKRPFVELQIRKGEKYNYQ